MKKNLIYLCCGIVIGTILASSIIFAQSFTIEVEQPNLEYYINGEKRTPSEGEEGFLYRDRTYVPIRFVAEALGNRVNWDGSNNRISIDSQQSSSPKRHYYIDESNNLVVTDLNWNIIRNYRLQDLKNLDSILSESPGYIDNFERMYHRFIGGYGDCAYLKILCKREVDGKTQMIDMVYEYNLQNDTYKLIEDTINGEVSSYQITDDKLLMGDDTKYVIYNITTQKRTQIPAGTQLQLTLDGDAMYYFLTTDGDKNIVYKQLIGSDEAIPLAQMPFAGYLKIADGWLYCINNDDFNQFERVRLSSI